MNAKATFILLSIIFINGVLSGKNRNNRNGQKGVQTKEMKYVTCTDDTKNKAAEMFHENVWPQLQRKNANYEVTSCLEKLVLGSSDKSHYFINVQVGSSKCFFKFNFNYSTKLSQRTILNDIEEQMEDCLAKIVEEFPEEVEEFDEEEYDEEDIEQIVIDQGLQDDSRSSSSMSSHDSFYDDMYNYDQIYNPLDQSNYSDNLSSSQYSSDSYEPTVSAKEQEPRFISMPKMEAVVGHTNLLGQWTYCTPDHHQQVPLHFNELMNHDLVVPMVIYKENIKGCQLQHDTQQFRIELSFNRQNCIFVYSMKQGDIRMVNGGDLQANACAKFLASR